MARVLVIDDDPAVLEVIAEMLRAHGHEAVAAPGGESGIKELESDHYDLVLTDLMMPDIDGMEVLKSVVAQFPDTKCIILTGYGTIRSSVEAVKMGAFDYITKPIEPDELLATIKKALKFKNLEEENIRLKRELRHLQKYDHLVGTSNAIQEIYSLIEKVADTDSTVLISGPSGTGKELIARAIHYHSSRADKPLVVINCGAIPETLLESELFGHEKGAYSGAHKTRIGRFEVADGGTIFLDEVGEMSPALQVKLLRVLQDQKFERVGGVKTIHVNVRILAATNQDLASAMSKGTFREDLYYRLNVIPIQVAPLKNRKADIPLLIDFFMKKVQKGRAKRITGFTADAMDAMHTYDWPGNVRELENVVKRLTILCDNQTVRCDDLPEHMWKKGLPIKEAEEGILNEGLNLTEAVRDYEKRLIEEALKKSNGVKTKAAKLLNIKRTTLVEKLKKQNFSEPVRA